MTDSPEGEGSPLARAMARDCVIATKPRDALGWLRPAGFNPPAPGGTCSVLTGDGAIWCGVVVEVERPRVKVKLLGSNIEATFVGCPCAPLRPHSRADARQIFERQRQYRPAATFSKTKDIDE